MKFVKFVIWLITILFVISTDKMKFKHKKAHSKKSKTFLDGPEGMSTVVSPNAQEGAKGEKFDQFSDLAKQTNILDMVPDQNPSSFDLKLGPGPFYYHGWVKYFKFNSDENQSTRPTTFFKNMEYFQQTRKFPGKQEHKDGNGENDYIKNEMFFYVKLTADSINVLSSKVEDFQKTFDTLSIDLITPQVEDRLFKGGITDFGSFSEGFCFRVDTSTMILLELPKENTRLKSWIFCTETAKEKADFMTTLRKIKISRQRKQGLIIDYSVPAPVPSVGDIVYGLTPNLKKDKEGNLGVTFNSTNSKIVDGYWITLQEWTQCSLKCGGGVSTLHKLCVPPKQGGKPCDGPAILTKPCNIQPCPQVKELKKFQLNKTRSFEKPVVKIMPFSDRPQRYTKCIVKESDMMYTKMFTEKVQYVENVQLPVRLVMNNRTISIFGSTNYDSVLSTFDLRKTEISPSKMHMNCFILSQGDISDLNHLQAEICPFGLDRAPEIYQEWIYDFNLFKYQCHSEKEIVDLDAADARALEDKFKKKVDSAKLDIVEDRVNMMKDKLQKDSEKNYNIQIQKTNQMAIQAVQKEMTLEEMVKKEEEEREDLVEKELMAKLDEEKEKQNCLVKKIQEKELEDQYNLKSQEAAAEIKRISDLAQKQVIIKRSQMKSDVLKMRKTAQRKKAALTAELQAVRIQMSKSMSKVYKEGDKTKCKTVKSKTDKETYCGFNFPDDYVRYNDCLEEEDFCSFCCETEFGDMHMDKRQDCYDTICAAAKKMDEDGRWLWVVDTNNAISNDKIPPLTS